MSSKRKVFKALAVAAGMLVATALAVLLIPVLFVFIENLGGKKPHKAPDEGTTAHIPVVTGGH